MQTATISRLCFLIALVSVAGCSLLETSTDLPDAGTVAELDAGADAGTSCITTGCDDSNPCTTDSCTATGCTHTPSSGATCDDGNACTQTDVCENGICAGSDPVTCAAPGICEEQGVCDPSSGTCSHPIRTPGTDCDDDNLSTYDDACDENGSCVGVAVECPSNSGCVSYSPNGTDTCMATPHEDDSPCNDGNGCTQSDSCQQGVCTGSNPVTCGAPGVCEEQGSCNPGTGQCTHPLSTPGTGCDDGSLMTFNDTCNALGTCQGLIIHCPVSTPCVWYIPNGTGVCTVIPHDGVACDDGNACTQSDICEGTICTGQSPVTCAPASGCQSAGVCNPTTGACSTSTAPTGTACDDGNVATYSDTCNASGSCAGTVVTCPPDDACTTYVPNGTSTCSPVYLDGDPCDDNNACTASGTCNHGTCALPAPTVCDSAHLCQNGTCVCPTGWTGPSCTTDVDECANNPNICGGGSACTNTAGSYTCQCIPNYSSPTGTNCTNSVGALELVFFYDASAARKLGPNPETKLAQIFTRAKQLYDNSFPALPMTLSLNGMVRLDTLPAPITVRACNTPAPSQPSCTGCWVGPVPSNCTSPDSTSASEIDVDLFLSSFITYTHVTRKANLNTFSGGIDVPVLFTDADFASSTIGLGSVAAACNSYSGAVIQLLNASDINETALTVTHELGHNLSMQHDASGASYIMAPSINTSNTSFSPASISAYTSWRSNLGSSDCMSDVAHDDWQSHLCGNGKIDPGESCDPGVETDSCCSSTCQLKPGCLCGNTEPCCQNGTPRASGTVCRASIGVCDIADTCDGISGLCRDTFQPAGTVCGNGGLCLQRECAPSRTDQCRGINGGQYPTQTGCASSTRCDRLDCSLNSTCDISWNVAVEDGSSCGTGKQCLAGVCVAAAGLHEYAWVPGAWSACTNGVSTRTVPCVNEAGATAASSACDQSSMPAASRTCTP